MSTQIRSAELRAREETRGLFAAAVEGHRDCLPFQAAEITRYTKGECGNPLEKVALMLRLLPEDRAAQLMAYLEDTYEDAHGSDPGSLIDAMRAEHEADVAEDVVQYETALDFSPARLREFIARNRAQDAAGRRARRAAMRALADSEPIRFPAKPAAWRTREAGAA